MQGLNYAVAEFNFHFQPHQSDVNCKGDGFLALCFSLQHWCIHQMQNCKYYHLGSWSSKSIMGINFQRSTTWCTSLYSHTSPLVTTLLLDGFRNTYPMMRFHSSFQLCLSMIRNLNRLHHWNIWRTHKWNIIFCTPFTLNIASILLSIEMWRRKPMNSKILFDNTLGVDKITFDFQFTTRSWQVNLIRFGIP